MESLDITSEGLSAKGIALKKEHKVVALYYNGSCIRSDIYRGDGAWDRTTKKLHKKLEEQSLLDKLTIQEVLSCISKNYPVLMNGDGAGYDENLPLSSSAASSSPSIDANIRTYQRNQF